MPLSTRSVSHDSNGKEQAGMGIACGDVDGDGRPDLFVTNFSGESNAMYRSSRGKGFREHSHVLGLGGPSISQLGWGTGLFDFDLDGDLDLFVLNGHVYPEADRAGTDTSYAQSDQLFRGDRGRFVAGAFRLRIVGPSRSLRLIESVANWRSTRLQMPYGDQAIFLRADLFHAVGGYGDLPFMEDFELVRRLRRLGRIGVLRESVVTSARRWHDVGAWRTTAINQVTIAAYFLGVSPARLGRWYRRF